jgi:hypothetical protein
MKSQVVLPLVFFAQSLFCGVVLAKHFCWQIPSAHCAPCGNAADLSVGQPLEQASSQVLVGSVAAPAGE